MTTDYKERDNAFTGKILKVTVDVKPIGAAVKAEADTGQHMAGVKKALSDSSVVNHAGRGAREFREKLKISKGQINRSSRQESPRNHAQTIFPEAVT